MKDRYIYSTPNQDTYDTYVNTLSNINNSNHDHYETTTRAETATTRAKTADTTGQEGKAELLSELQQFQIKPQEIGERDVQSESPRYKNHIPLKDQYTYPFGNPSLKLHPEKKYGK